MSETTVSQSERCEYRERRWQATARPRLFPLSRLVISAILSLGQLGASELRHRWNAKSPAPDVVMAGFWFIVVGIVVYMVIYALEWSWNYVAVAPAILDKQSRTGIEHRDTTIADLTEKLATQNSKQEIRKQFAALMDESAKLELQLRITQDNAKFSDLMPSFTDWVGKAAKALDAAGFQTDGSAFLRAGEQHPSTAELNRFEHLAVWKRGTMAQLDAYRNKLQEIISRNQI